MGRRPIGRLPGSLDPIQVSPDRRKDPAPHPFLCTHCVSPVVAPLTILLHLP